MLLKKSNFLKLKLESEVQHSLWFLMEVGVINTLQSTSKCVSVYKPTCKWALPQACFITAVCAWKHEGVFAHKNDRLHCDIFKTHHQVPSSKRLLVSGLRDRMVNHPSSSLPLHADWNAKGCLSSHQKNSHWGHEKPFLSVITFSTVINIYSSLHLKARIMLFRIFRCNFAVVIMSVKQHQSSVARLSRSFSQAFLRFSLDLSKNIHIPIWPFLLFCLKYTRSTT